MDNNYYNNMNQNQNQSTQNNQNGYNPYNSNSQGQTYQNTSYNAYNPYQQPTGGPAPGNRVADPDSELPLVSVRQLLWSLVW